MFPITLLLLPYLLPICALPSLPALTSIPDSPLLPDLPANTYLPIKPADSPANSTVAEITITCFTPHDQIRPITIGDCIRAVNLIRQDIDFDRVEDWSAARSGHQILRHWTWGPCAVALFPDSETAADTFSLQPIALAAMNVMTVCVAKNDHRGGRMKVGPKEEFSVGVRHTQTGSWVF